MSHRNSYRFQKIHHQFKIKYFKSYSMLVSWDFSRKFIIFCWLFPVNLIRVSSFSKIPRIAFGVVVTGTQTFRNKLPVNPFLLSVWTEVRMKILSHTISHNFTQFHTIKHQLNVFLVILMFFLWLMFCGRLSTRLINPEWCHFECHPLTTYKNRDIQFQEIILKWNNQQTKGANHTNSVAAALLNIVT